PIGRCRVEGDRVTRPEDHLLEPDRHAQRAAQDIAPLLSRVTLELVLRARRPADLVGHVEEVDVRDRGRRQPFPDDAGGEPDHLAIRGPLNGIGRQLDVATRAVGARPGVDEQQLVERDPELVGDGVEGADGRLGATGLDLRDQARGDAEALGQATQAQPAGLPDRPNPVAHLAIFGCRSVPSPPGHRTSHGASSMAWYPGPCRAPRPPCGHRAACSIIERLPRRQGSQRMSRPFASPGAQTVDWEERVNTDRLRTYRLGRAKAALATSEVGAVLLFDFNNIRYVTSTHIGEWARDKMTRFALLTRSGEPHLWDFGSAAKHHRLYCPWLPPENVRGGMIGLRGAVAPDAGLFTGAAREVADILRAEGVADMPLGVDIVEPPMWAALQDLGIRLDDAQQTMRDAPEGKSQAEITLLNTACAMADGAYQRTAEQLKPGIKESQLVANVTKLLFDLGSEHVDNINAV